MKRFVVCLAAIAVALTKTTASAGTTFVGAPADELVFFNDPGGQAFNEGAPGSLLGLPDGIFRDLEEGGATVRFAGVTQLFDYAPVQIPAGTDLVIVDAGASLDIPILGFGYGQPVDADLDGDADAVAGVPILIGTAGPQAFPWGSVFENSLASILFYDLDSATGFAGVTPDFFISIDSPGDQEIDSLQLVPEPSSCLLSALGLIVLTARRSVKRKAAQQGA